MVAQNFYLPQLDMSANQTTDASMQWQNTTVITTNFDANAQVDVSYNILQDMFQFYTTDVSGLDWPTNDPVDLKYRVVWNSTAQPLHIDINHNTTVYQSTVGSFTNNPVLTLDWIRWLAQCLFNTPLGVDLFNNEETVRSSLATAFSSDLNTKFTELNAATTVNSVNDGTYYSAGSPNASQSILSQIIGSAPSRLSDLIESGTTNWFKCPIMAGDFLYFTVKIRAKSDQHNLTGVASVADRTYLLKINAVAV